MPWVWYSRAGTEFNREALRPVRVATFCAAIVRVNLKASVWLRATSAGRGALVLGNVWGHV
jgi:hypothetical protein